MPRDRYWLLAHAQEDEKTGSLPPVEIVVSIPWWTEVVKWEHKEGNEFVAAPILFTKQEAAEAQLQEWRDAEPDYYLELVNEHGEDLVNRAMPSSSPLHVFSIDREWLLDRLGDSDFLCVMVDGRLRLRQDFMEELSKDA
jgi:hypothetical protein